MSSLRSPLKSPTWTSTQVTLGFQFAQRVVLKPFDPLESPTHQLPLCKSRPMMSACPSPLKSPVCTSTQVAFGFQVVHKLSEKEEPVEAAIHHCPVAPYRPRMLVLAGGTDKVTSLPAPPV